MILLLKRIYWYVTKERTHFSSILQKNLSDCHWSYIFLCIPILWSIFGFWEWLCLKLRLSTRCLFWWHTQCWLWTFQIPASVFLPLWGEEPPSWRFYLLNHFIWSTIGSQKFSTTLAMAFKDLPNILSSISCCNPDQPPGEHPFRSDPKLFAKHMLENITETEHTIRDAWHIQNGWIFVKVPKGASENRDMQEIYLKMRNPDFQVFRGEWVCRTLLGRNQCLFRQDCCQGKTETKTTMTPLLAQTGLWWEYLQILIIMELLCLNSHHLQY